MWKTYKGKVTEEAEEWHNDDGGQGWRVYDEGSNHCLPLKFGRQRDAENAAQIMNDLCPCDSIVDVKTIGKIIHEEFGSIQRCTEYLIGRCCAW